MKTKLLIAFILFANQNVFGQNTVDVQPGKLKIWSNNTLLANNYSFPGPQYSGIENLVTLNCNSYLSYANIVGIRNIVTATNGIPGLGTTGISSSATAEYNSTGVMGIATGDRSYGLSGFAHPTVATQNGSYTGVSGTVTAAGTNAVNQGVIGTASGSGSSAYNYGIFGIANGSGSTATNYGIFGYTNNSNSTSYAGYFNGKVHVSGTLSKSAGTFKIDHPLDPQNKYLSHSFVESPDMMNIYNGNITTGQNGRATVSLPDYFEALNMDFRYQLTSIGSPAQAYVFEEVKENQFVIATDKPNIKVSWQVTGVRNDAYAKKNRIVPEEDKPASEKGKYLNAEAFGLPREESLHAVKSSETVKK